MAVRSFSRIRPQAHLHRAGRLNLRPATAGGPGDDVAFQVSWPRALRPEVLPPNWRDWAANLRLAGWLLLAAAVVGAGVAWRSTWLTPSMLDAVGRLGLAAAVGLSLTALQRLVSRGRSAGRPLERAQVLLAVAGALTMLLVDNSLARAFGVAGVASIVRFRTPVEDPGDATVLFLAMGLGMCSGVGAFTLVFVGAVVIAGVLLMSRTGIAAPVGQALGVEVVSTAAGFSLADVTAVFASHGVDAELVEWKQNGEVRARFRAMARPGGSVADLARDLKGRPGVAAVTCEVRKNFC